MAKIADMSVRVSKRSRKRPVLGICGLALAFLGAGVGLFLPQIVRVAAPARPVPRASAEVETESPRAIRAALRSRLWMVSVAAGLSAILLGVLSLFRREGILLGPLSALIGAAVVVWPYLLAGIVLSK